jgi:hypothetical protein
MTQSTCAGNNSNAKLLSPSNGVTVDAHMPRYNGLAKGHLQCRQHAIVGSNEREVAVGDRATLKCDSRESVVIEQISCYLDRD